MQVKKEQWAGSLYLGYQYSLGILQRQNPRERGERKKITTEGKKKINQVQRIYNLALHFEENFKGGRDIIARLGWNHDPTPAEDRNAKRRFNERMEKEYAALGVEYRWIDVKETHGRDGEPRRLHHHVIISGTGRPMLKKIMECWDGGTVDVQTLREGVDGFKDTAEYMLKERRPPGSRAYTCSRNLRRPPDPLRRKVSERQAGEVPPGVTILKHELRDTVAGRYEIMVGVIVDKALFEQYIDRARRDVRTYDAARFWRARAARKSMENRIRGQSPYLAGNRV